MADFIGSILELKGNRAIVMTGTCDFVKIKKQPGMFVGQQIRYKESDICKAKKSNIKYLSLVASVLLVIFSYGLYQQFFMPNTVYAYIDVDINPSVELAIDKDARVLEAKPLNEDAKALLKDIKLKNLPVREAVAEIIKESQEQGFITPDNANEVLVSASIDKEKSGKDITLKDKIVDEVLNDIGNTQIELQRQSIKPQVLKVTPENRSVAVENEISMGRMSLYNEIKKEDANITLDQAKATSVADMMDKAKLKTNKENKQEEKEEKKEDKEKEKTEVENNRSSDNIDRNNIPADKNTESKDKKDVNNDNKNIKSNQQNDKNKKENDNKGNNKNKK